MPAEKQNNISDKLDAMRSLPEGYNFRPDAVWNRMELQLKKTTINYKAVFFAAASFIAVILFIAFPSKRNDITGRVNSKPEQILPVKINSENPVVVTYAENKKSGPKSNKTRSVLQAEKIYTAKRPLQDLVISRDIAPVLQKKEEDPVPEIKTEVQTVVPLVTAKSKPRFPVAHVNELYKAVPVEEEEPVTRSKTSFAFRKHTYDAATPVTNFEDGFTERKKPKTIFPLLNSSQ